MPWGLAMTLAGITAGLPVTLSAAETASAAAPAPVSRETMRNDPAVKAQLRALEGAATIAHDLWTATLAQTWAENLRLDLRTDPPLGNTMVFGDPAFACPDDIIFAADFGDHVAALTRHAWHRFLPDGRPSAPAVGFNLDGSWGALSPGGSAAALVNTRQPDDGHKVTVNIHVVAQAPAALDKASATAPATLTLQQSRDEKADAECDGNVFCADDGSAAAVGINDREGNHLDIFANNEVKTTKLHQVVAIGPNATWIIAYDDQNHLVLKIADKRTVIDAGCAGPGGRAAVIINHQPSVVGRDGKLTPLAAPIAFGDNARATTLGRWLCLGSGDNAKALPEVDMLGVEHKSDADQPNMVAVWRWDDLTADDSAPAVQAWTGFLDVCRYECAGILRAHDKQVDIIDLAGHNPVVRTLARLDHGTDRAWEQLSKVMANATDGGGVTILDITGKVVGQEKNDIRIMHGPWMVVLGKDKTTYELVKLAADPAARTRVKLPITGEWDFSDDHYQQRLLATNDDKWSLLDYSGKKLLSDSPNGPKKPGVGEYWPPDGRFFFHFARLYTKLAGEDVPPAQRLAPSDAWMIDRYLLVLSREQEVLVTGRKKGEWLDLGRAYDATQFGGRGNELDLCTDDNRAVGAITNGPTLVPANGQTMALPSGSWRISGLDFVAPRDGSMTWSTDATGFTPTRLRNPPNGDPSSLLVITPSLVLLIDPQVAPSIGHH